eukprot:scaffold12058_cov51-Phaeocystis_antarctica.AAC.1
MQGTCGAPCHEGVLYRVPERAALRVRHRRYARRLSHEEEAVAWQEEAVAWHPNLSARLVACDPAEG